MTRIAPILVVIAALACAATALAQGTQHMYYIGPFEGEVTVKDGQTPGPPGYYYRPEPSETPTFTERYEHPVRCAVCGHWRDLGERCPFCGHQPARYERSQARRGSLYSPYALPGQYWYREPMRSVTGPKHGMGWPYLSPRYR
ncbi:MAG: hypothetical protein U9R79_12630 [Armatimonadota bacterium]|nr:hypothetical protein [Armatimonadota bacterium]